MKRSDKPIDRSPLRFKLGCAYYGARRRLKWLTMEHKFAKKRQEERLPAVRFGFKETISAWGWLLLIVGGLIIAILGVGKFISPIAIKWAVIVIGVLSALAIYLFNTPGRNPLVNIGAGLWDTYNMATGILGDVLSYIRLFALGLAGGMLGQAFNNLGQMVLGDGNNIILWLPFVLILLFGHVLNILMSSLGAFVHPLRLTFVEYFKNAGYEGKGAAYNPLTTNKE